MRFRQSSGTKSKKPWKMIGKLRLSLALVGAIFKRGDKDMAVIYASLIVSGYKTFGQVPKVIQPQVKEVLIQLGLGELAE